MSRGGAASVVCVVTLLAGCGAAGDEAAAPRSSTTTTSTTATSTSPTTTTTPTAVGGGVLPAISDFGPTGEVVAGVPLGVVQPIRPPPPLETPIAPEDMSDRGSELTAPALTAAARTTLGSQWSADVTVLPDSAGDSHFVGTGRAWHDPVGRLDVQWEDGRTDLWSERRHAVSNVDPAVGLLLLVSGGGGAVESPEGTFRSMGTGYCHGRMTINPLVSTHDGVMCATWEAEVADGRVVGARSWRRDQGSSPWSEGQSPQVEIRLDARADESLRPSGPTPEPTCILVLTLDDEWSDADAVARVDALRTMAERWGRLESLSPGDLSPEGLGVNPGCPDPVNPLGPDAWVVTRG